MEASSSLAGRRVQNRASYALVTVLIEVAAATYRALARGLASLVAAQRQAQARSDLLALSDRSLRDIGLSRAEIERMFH
ncbi:MAG TPA: DUF1127 domain-containing protein [Burkholderiales bacterium]